MWPPVEGKGTKDFGCHQWSLPCTLSLLTLNIVRTFFYSCHLNWTADVFILSTQLIFTNCTNTFSFFLQFEPQLQAAVLHEPSLKWSLVTGQHQKCFPSLRPIGLDAVNSMDQVFVWSPVFLTGDRSVDHLVHFVWSAMWTK